MKKNLVSIILPVYNRENTISNSIDSVLNQTYSNWELIIVDDGSTDNTGNSCKKFLSDSRIKYYKIDNVGPSGARNYGLKCIVGEYLMFIDSDDTYESNMIFEMINGITYNKNSMIVCTYNNILNNSYSEEFDYKTKIEILQKNSLYNLLWNKLYISEIVIKNNIKFNETIISGEDYRFNIDYCKYIEDIYYINKSLYNYQVQGDSITQKIRNNYFDVGIANLEHNLYFYIEKKWDYTYLLSNYIVLAKRAVWMIDNSYKDKSTKKAELEKICKVLSGNNLLQINIYEANLNLSLENRLVCKLYQKRMSTFLIIFSRIRNIIKRILKGGKK